MKYEYKTKYKSETGKYSVGKVFASNYFGPYKILGKTNDPKGDQYIVEFLSTGYQTKIKTSSIKKGMVKDLFIPCVYGVGYMGGDKHRARVNNKSVRTYGLWTHMLERCYVGYDIYKSYKDIYVCSRWHNYQHFCEDIKNLEGYVAWLNGYNMSLDKDIRSNGTYSPESCMFITKAENSRESALRNHSNKK